VDDRLAAAARRISPAERRVAEVVAAQRELVAFGTVAEVAEQAGASGASVVRLADRLGYRGFRGLQAAVRDELSSRLRPATEKIRRPVPVDLLDGVGRDAAAAVGQTFSTLDRTAWERAVRLLSTRRHRVFVLSGDAGAGVGRQVLTHLSMLRDGVTGLDGSTVAVGRQLAAAAEGDVLLCIDLPRHDRSVLDTVAAARRRGLVVIAVTDSPLSPLATDGAVLLSVGAHDVGPFDSYVAALAVAETLVAGAAIRLRGAAVEHLDSIADLWEETGAIDV